jgi:hypothetical protein
MKVSTLPDQKAKLSSSKVLTTRKVFYVWRNKNFHRLVTSGTVLPPSSVTSINHKNLRNKKGEISAQSIT